MNRPTRAFVGDAKATTLHRDINAMRSAVGSGDIARIDDAWTSLERWLSCVQVIRGHRCDVATDLRQERRVEGVG